MLDPPIMVKNVINTIMMLKKKKEHILHSLYIELVKLQKEIISSNLRVLIIFEGRDAAGKDGTIKTITDRKSVV
jgi:Uncharacterized conserved protein